VLATRAVLQRFISGLHEDPSYRNRVMSSALVVVLLVGAFASGLEVQVRFGQGTRVEGTSLTGTAAPERAQGRPPGGGRAPAAATAPAPSRPGVDMPAPLRLDAGAPVPALTDPASGPAPPPLRADLPPGAEVPAPPDPFAGAISPPSGDGDGRCIVTDTVILLPLETEELPGEACEEVTEQLDDLRAPDVEVPDPPEAQGPTAASPARWRPLSVARAVLEAHG
jgi:hypothetical protein